LARRRCSEAFPGSPVGATMAAPPTADEPGGDRLSSRYRFLISWAAVSSACAAVAVTTPAVAQPPPADCMKAETQAECHKRLKCKPDEELEDCKKRLRAAAQDKQGQAGQGDADKQGADRDKGDKDRDKGDKGDKDRDKDRDDADKKRRDRDKD